MSVVALLLVAAMLAWPGSDRQRRSGAGAVLPAPRFDRGRREHEGRSGGAAGGDRSAGPRTTGVASHSWASRVRWRRARRPLQPGQVLTLLEGLVPALHAGLPPAEALALQLRTHADTEPGAVGRRWHEQLTWVARQARDGRLLAPTWRELARTEGSAELELLSQAWALSERLGSPLAVAADTTAGLVRARIRAEQRVVAATTGAHATMNLLTLLPLGGTAIAALLGISPAQLYARSPLAMGSCAVGVCLLLGGRLLVRRMVRRSLRPRVVT